MMKNKCLAINAKLSVFVCSLLLCATFATSQSASIKPSHSFKVGDKTFLLDNQLFLVKAAELHYPRIPMAYWDHRIKMCKALGMNTICMYVFWNYHEQTPGVYDFAGQKDIAAFCRLAQANGMYVIVRPGPYVCAEWEMGGLPWWLLKHKGIELRTQDPYFLERTRLFMLEVGKQLADLQVNRGGNIIMVQVENEYGSYGVNKPYVAKIRDVVREAGFTDVPLFQCDWSSNFTDNALDDLLWTVNFGTGSNIGQQFAELKRLRPNTPLMCSEFWSGWFDNWGRKHETRDPKSMVDGLSEMLSQGISFSLYMTHGGTTFGHWGGANSPGFSPMCTSYDYDAPINEYGRVTPKYFLLRDLLSKYLAPGETLPAVPDSIPTIVIPSFSLTEVSSLMNLDAVKPIVSDTTLTFEEMSLGYGCVLYRAMLNPSKTTQWLRIEDVHDWAQVFLDGKRIGVLDRRLDENRIELPSLKSATRLDILVEAMGRVNFSKAINDPKGITKGVALVTGDKETPLKGWSMYRIASDYDMIRQRAFKPMENGLVSTAYYRGTFTVDKVGDTFLDMSSWGKGQVWVNGHAIGRYWKIGPTQTLYVPGCWLNVGRNEVVVLELDKPEKPVLAGLNYPILDQLRLPEPKQEDKQQKPQNLGKKKLVAVGSFAAGNGWQTIYFKRSVKARYVCLEALSSFGQDPYASVAELEVLGANKQKVSRFPWKVVYVDSQEMADANNMAEKVFDLQESTFWHTQYTGAKPGYPHRLVIDLGVEQVVTGFMYLPRPEAGKPGMIREYRFFASRKPF